MAEPSARLSNLEVALTHRVSEVISSWPCNVRTAVVSSVSVGLIESCGSGSHGCGTTGDRHCSFEGRPSVSNEIRNLGVQLAKTTIAKYMVRQQKPTSQTW